MLRVAVGFNSGMGNFIIFRSVLQAIAHHVGGPVDLFLDKDRDSVGELAAEQIGRALPSVVRKVLKFPQDYVGQKYDIVFMSIHSNGGPLFASFSSDFYVEEIEPWAQSFISELAFYYYELQTRLGYRGPVFPQLVPFDRRVFKKYEKLRGISVTNGWVRSGGGEWERKYYPHFGDVLETISNLYPERTIFLLGGEDDRDWAGEMRERVPTCEDLVGRLDILQSFGVVKASSIFIGNDTGLLHAADAFSVPSVGVFGATLVSKNGPIRNSTIVIRSPITCAPCQGTFFFHMCKSQERCMKIIHPSYVVSAFRKLVRRFPF